MKPGEVRHMRQMEAGKTYNAYMRARACVPLISFSCRYVPHLPHPQPRNRSETGMGGAL